MDLVENGSFGASPTRTSVASIPAGGFFFVNVTFVKKHVFPQSDITTKKKPPAGMLATEVRSGDAPKPQVSMKTDEKQKRKSTPDQP